MEIRVLGPLEVLDGDHRVEVSAPKQRLLLSVLALSPGKVVTTDRLIDELWGDSPPAGGAKTLHYHVSKLRESLRCPDDPEQRSVIATRPGGYVLDVDPDDIDATHFAHEVIDARRLLELDPARASARLSDALDLWRGSTPDEWWDSPMLELEARRLAEQRLGSIEDRIGADLATGRHADVVSELEALTAEHPLRERLWAFLMVALYRSDRQGEALRAYDRLRRHLADELGIDPSPDLRRLEESILRQDADLSVPEGLRQPASLRGYELAEPVGEGAFGVVYRATQVSVEREVALKIVRPEHSNRPGSVLGFQAQAQILAALDHPHIVPVYDFWRDPDGAYLVMPLMPGGNLTMLDTTGWETPQVVATLEQIAGALAHAHRLGVVHADLHPGNVLFDAGGNAYLADFGLAANLSGGTSTPPTAYASPEQLDGAGADRTADVYGLARLAMRLFTGSDPGADAQVVHVERAGLRSAVDGVLRRATSSDPALRHEDASAFLHDFRLAMGSDAPRPVASRNPYKGLRPFFESDATDFFGRRALVDELVGFLSEHRLLALVGPSGSGKSSVVNAGLLPALRSGAVPGSDSWVIASLYPGTDPFSALTEALQTVAVERVPDLRMLDSSLDRAIGRIVPDGDLLILIDQFEEVFNLVDEAAERRRFLDVLSSLVTETSGVRLVLTMRADRLGAALDHSGFGGVLRTAVVGITPPSPDELAQAINGPAAGVGVDVEPELVADIVGDLSGEPGGLPLMQYALTRLFDEREGTVLGTDAYRRIGGLEEALAGWPEELYSSFDDRQRQACRTLFLTLVSVDDDGRVARRRASLPDLYSLGVDRLVVDDVVGRFGEIRLLTTDHDPETRIPTVEIAHEALLDRWGRLRGWIDERGEMLMIQRTFRRALGEWEEAARHADYLLTGGRLDHFESWAHSTDLPFSERETAYLEASLELEDEKTAGRRRTRRLVFAGLTAIALVAVLFGVAALLQRSRALDQQVAAEEQAAVAVHQADRADEQARLAAAAEAVAESERDRATAQELIARARSLAAAAMANLDDDPELAVLLAIEAVEVTEDAPLREAVEALHVAVNTNRLVFTMPVEQWDRTVVYDPDGGHFYTGGRTGGEVIDLAGRESVAPLSVDIGNIAKLAIAGADDELLVVSHYAPGLITVLDRATFEPLFQLEGHERWVTDLDVSADGSILASVDPYQGRVMVWDLVREERIAEFDCPGCGGGVAMSADGTLVASGGTVWEVASGDALHTGLVEGASRDVEIDGERVYVASDTEIQLIDLESGDTISSYTGHSAEVAALDVSPDGAWLASGGNDGRVFLWDASGVNSAPVLELPAQQGTVWEVAFSPDGRLLTSVSGRQELPLDLVDTWPRDWQARTWDVSFAGVGEVLSVASRDGQVAFISPGDRVVVAGAGNGAVVWDLESGTEVVRFSDGSQVDAISVSPDGAVAALAGASDGLGWAAVFDTATGEMASELLTAAPDVGPQSLTFSADGSRLALVATGLAQVWDVSTWAVDLDLSSLTPATDYSAVAFHPSSDLVLTQFLPFTDWGWPAMHLWDVTSGELRSELAHVPRAGRGDIAFSPDGRVFVSAGTGRPQLIEPYTARALTRLEGSPPYAVSVAYSPDGARIATGEADGTIRMWDPATGEETLVLEGHRAMVVDVAFSPDGSRLASVSQDGVAKVWALEVAALLDIARDSVERELSDVECRTYVGVDCSPAPGVERLIPATSEWDRPFGIDGAAWESADRGGSWTEIGALEADGDWVLAAESRSLMSFNDLWDGRSWVVDLDTMEWSEVSSMPGVPDPDLPPDVPPPPGSIGLLVDLPGLDQVLATRLDDGATMAYSPASDTWTQVADLEDAFLGRYGMGVALDTESNVVVLFGGAHWGRTDEGKHVGLGDTWVYDIDSSTWTEVTPALSPPARIDPTIVYDSDADRMVLFGGHTELSGDVLGDTWIYDVDSNTWTEVEASPSPPARSGHVAWYDPQVGSTFVFGGGGEWSSWPPLPWTALGAEELWGFDLESQSWTLYRADPHPDYRLPGAVVWDDVAGGVLLLGGDVYDADRLFRGWVADIWTYRPDGSPAPVLPASSVPEAEPTGVEGLHLTVEPSNGFMWANSPGDEIVFDITVGNTTAERLSGLSVTFVGDTVVEDVTLDGNASWTGEFRYTVTEDDLAGLRFSEPIDVTVGRVDATGTDVDGGVVFGVGDAMLTVYRVRACRVAPDSADGGFVAGPYNDYRECSFSPDPGTYWMLTSTEAGVQNFAPTIRDGVPGNWCDFDEGGELDPPIGSGGLTEIAYFPSEGVCLGGGADGDTIPVRNSATYYLAVMPGHVVEAAPCESCS